MTTPSERVRSCLTPNRLRSRLGATCVGAAVVLGATAVGAGAQRTSGVVPVGTGTTQTTVVGVVAATPGAPVGSPTPATGVVGARASLEPIPSPIPAGQWVCPAPTAKFRNDWGNARSGGRSHEGTDMMAPMGTPIVAPIAGTIRFDESARGGRQFWLKSDDGQTVYGAHLNSFGTPGRVAAGTVIGTVGDTGNAKGTPHLHFEVHPAKGQKINPFPLLESIC